jgi:cytosine/adenosine deaminase-related metal-dependent hydrolase
MPRFRADWILPVSARPQRRGWVAIADGRIGAMGDDDAEAIDLGRVALLPALVNAHTHLELSYLHRRVPAHESFTQWVRSVMTLRGAYTDAADPVIIAAARDAIRDARAAGTGLFGEVSNTLATVALLTEAPVQAHVFYELTGFTEPDPAGRVRVARQTVDAAGITGRDVRLSIAPHAPYSVSAALFMAIRSDLDAHSPTVSTVHLGESVDEVALLRDGSGGMRAVLEDLGRWPDGWKPPGVSPVEYVSSLGFLDSRILAVHGVQCDGADLARLSALGATLVSCPRSNLHVGAGSPPLEAFYAMDVAVAFGTDSLASVADLNMFTELAEARRIAPRVPARQLIESATRVGARALGFGGECGALEPGLRADVIGVRLPEGVTDVEEYLVGGVDPAAIFWVEA